MPERLRTKGSTTAAAPPRAAPKAASARRRTASRPRAAKSAVVAAGSPCREEMIALDAYFRAQSRGFAPGMELDDWLAAEAEVDRRLAAGGLQAS